MDNLVYPGSSTLALGTRAVVDKDDLVYPGASGVGVELRN